MINICGLLIKRPLVKIQNKMSTVAKSAAPVKEAISVAITEHFQPVYLEVVNESYMHNVPKGSETHFKVLIVSKKFEDLPLLKRHRLVNKVVQEKLGELFPHALSLETKTPKQWQPSHTIEPSPNCRGGFGK